MRSIGSRCPAGVARESAAWRGRSPRSRRPSAIAARARGRGAVVPLADGAERIVRELALAVFAASRDEHATERETRSQRFARFLGSFDADGYLAGLERNGIRWLSRRDGMFPRAAGSDQRPTAGALPSRDRAGRAAVRAERRDRRRAQLQRLRRPCGSRARPRARGGRRRRRLGARARDRRLGASRRARGGAHDRRRSRLRDRPRLPARALAARAPGVAERPARLRVPAGRRSGAVAVPGPQPHRRGPLRRDRRRRSARAERCADHGRPRPRGGPRRARSPRRDHVEPLEGHECAAPARRDAA